MRVLTYLQFLYHSFHLIRAVKRNQLVKETRGNSLFVKKTVFFIKKYSGNFSLN